MPFDIHIAASERSVGYTVREGDRYIDGLCWDEMLAQLVSLTHPGLGKGMFEMLTAEQWKARERVTAARMDLLEAELERDRLFGREGCS